MKYIIKLILISSSIWDASNMSSGVYLVKAESSSSVDIQKVMLIK